MQSTNACPSTRDFKSLIPAIIKSVILPYVFLTILVVLTSIQNTFAQESAQSPLYFVEIMPNPEGTDTKTNEYFKINNDSTTNLSIENYKVCNVNNDCYFLKGTMEPKSCLKVYRTDFIFTLHNDREVLSLFDSNGNLIDEIIAESAPSGKTWSCSSSNCEWSDPRETCDYSNITDEEIANEETENNTGDSTSNSASDSNENDNIAEDGFNSNNNLAETKKKIFEIESENDWEKVKKEIKTKNLISLVVSLQGEIVAPYNIVKANCFYLNVGGKLVQVNIYTSRKDEISNIKELYDSGNKVKIENGYLKNSLGVWQIGIGKSTILKANKTGKLLNSSLKPVASLNGQPQQKILKYANKPVKITGKIIKKSGQYFYLEKDGQIFPVFIPSITWSRYLAKQNLGTFPELINKKIVTAADYKDKELNVVGLLETSENTFRVLVIHERDICPDKEKSEEKNKSDISQSTQVSTDPTLEQKYLSLEEKSETPKFENSNSNSNLNSSPNLNIRNDTLRNIFAKSLSWNSLWNLIATKLTLNVKKLF